MRTFNENIASPIKDGKFQFGTYNKSFEKINLLDAEKPLGNFSPQFLKNFKLKEWQAFQIGNERFFMLVAIYNAKFTGVAQFLIIDKKENKQYFYKKQPSPSQLHTPERLTNSSAKYESKNLNISVNYNDKGEITLKASSKNYKNLPDFEAEFFASLEEKTPQIVCIPFAENRGMYSQKSAVTAEGKLKIGENLFSFEKSTSFLILDDHKGFYPNPMVYDWCTGAKNESEKFIAFNLTDNQSINAEKFNENCLWINDKIYLLPTVKFSRPQGVLKTWKINDKEGFIDIKFSPNVDNNFLLNVLIIKSDYYGPFGYFKGFIKTPEGEKIIIDNFYGMGEQKYIRG